MPPEKLVSRALPVVMYSDDPNNPGELMAAINAILQGYTYEGELMNVQVDEYVQGIVIIDTAHMAVHRGWMFEFEHSASVGNGNNLDIRIVTGAYDTHADFAIAAGGQVTVYLYESPTVSGGTPLNVWNMKRRSTIVPAITAFHTPTVTSVGTTPLVNGRLLPGGASQQTRIGGEARSGIEWILKTNTAYLLRVTNTSGSTININPLMQGYEVRL